MFEHTIQKEWTIKETIAKYDFINLRNCVHYKKKKLQRMWKDKPQTGNYKHRIKTATASGEWEWESRGMHVSNITFKGTIRSQF